MSSPSDPWSSLDWYLVAYFVALENRQSHYRKRKTFMAKDKDLRFIRTNQMLCSSFTELLDRKKFEDNFKRLTLGGTSCEGVFHSSWNVSDKIMIESYYI